MSQDKEREIQIQFLEEAQEYLNTIESKLLGISTNAEIDSQSLDAVLRAAHSIKGGAAMMGFQTLSELAHRLEDFFKVLKTQTSVNVEIEGLLLAGVDCLHQVIAASYQAALVDEQWLEEYVSPVFQQLDERLGKPQIEDTITPLAQNSGQDMVKMIFETEVEEYLQRLEAILANSEHNEFEEIFNMAQELGGLGEMLQLHAFTSLCASVTQQLETTPDRVAEIANLALQAWRRSQAAVIVGQIETIPTHLDADSATEVTEEKAVVVTKVPEIAMTSVAASGLTDINLELVPTTHVEENQENTVRVPVKQLEQLNDLFGELTISRNGINLQLERLRDVVKVLQRKMGVLQRSYTRLRTAYYKATQLDSPLASVAPVIETEQLNLTRSPEVNHDQDSDFNLLSQEVTANVVQLQEVGEDIDLNLKDADQSVSELNRTAKQLQTCITQLRMRPFSDLIGRFPRALRELALQYGKQVELKTQGGETLIDRSILEALNNPLMHLLRNAFDHGIEDPATRQACGKPEQGTIEIKAAYQGNQTLITVSDDGAGIDVHKIRQRAQQLGLDPAVIVAASDAEILTLIFEPGFSTAEQVNALSGRGVGMDVVRTNLRQIRGDIKVDTQLGVGTTFTLSVPLTLSVARVLLVESKGILLALPQNAIAEMVLLDPQQIVTIAGKQVLIWKGFMASLIRLSDWLKVQSSLTTVATEAMPLMSEPTVLMIAQGSEWIGLQVDRCWGEQEVAIRPVEGAIAMPPGFTGCTILGDGQVVPLVNPPELLHWIASCEQPPSSAGTKLGGCSQLA